MRLFFNKKKIIKYIFGIQSKEDNGNYVYAKGWDLRRLNVEKYIKGHCCNASYVGSL